MGSWHFIWQSLRRDRRSTALRVVAIAIMIAVTAITTVGFFTDRIEQLIQQQATELLAADIRLKSPEAFSPELLNAAAKLKQAQTLSFRSVLISDDDEVVLSEVKAVTDLYPLRGELKISESLYGEEIITTKRPQRGTVWLEPRLLQRLNKKIGDTIQLGESLLKISHILRHEPDRGGLFFQLAPRLLMHFDDVAATELISIGSRVTYHLLLSGEQQDLTDYQDTIKPLLQAGQQVESISNARPELNTALERADQFLSLSALVSVILAGAAIAIALQHFVREQSNNSAILRCLGATRRFVFWTYVARLTVITLIASLLGSFLGWIAQFGITALLADYLTNNQALPSPSLMPIVSGVTVGFVVLFGFALPPLLNLRHVSPLQVLRQDYPTITTKTRTVFAIALLSMAGLVIWQAGNITLGLWVTGGILFTLGFLLLIAYTLIQRLSYFRGHPGITWRFGLANLARRAGDSSVQLTAFGVSLMILLLLTIIRVDLLSSWQSQLPEGTPNHFVLNVPSEAQPVLQQQFTTEQRPFSGFYPMTTGRFMYHNEIEIKADNFELPRAKRFASRPFNLSSATMLPAANTVIAGEFWTEEGQHVSQEFSVEQGFAETFNIQMGDSLAFEFAGQAVKGIVTSIREVDWDSFQVNFFVLASPDIMQALPHTYVTSFYLAPNTNDYVADLVKRYPSITIIDVTALLTQIQVIMQRASLAIHYVFLFTLLASLVVLYAALVASQEVRIHEAALLRTLGATRKQLRISLLAEFLCLGSLAGILAATCATGLSYALSRFLFDLPYTFNSSIWVVALLVGTVGISIAGLWGTRHVTQHPPLRILMRT